MLGTDQALISPAGLYWPTHSIAVELQHHENPHSGMYRACGSTQAVQGGLRDPYI